MGLLGNVGAGASAGTAISPGLGTVIGAGLGLVGSGISAFSTNKANERNIALQRETNELNAKLARENYDLQRELLQKNLDFASPLNQRQMLEEAGYNPYDFVQGVGSKPVASTPTPQLPTMQSATVAPEDYGIGISKVGSELANYYATMQQARKASAEATGQQIDNDYKALLNEQDLISKGLYNQSMQLDWSWKLQTQEDRVLQEHLKNEFTSAQTKTELAKAAHEEIDNITRKSFNEKQLKQLDSSINLLIEQGVTEQSKQALNKAGVSEVVAKVARMAVQNAVDRMVGSAQVNYYNSAAANQRSQHDVNVIDRRTRQRNLEILNKFGFQKAYEELEQIRSSRGVSDAQRNEIEATITKLGEEARKLERDAMKTNEEIDWMKYDKFMQGYRQYMDEVQQYRRGFPGLPF